MSNDRLHIALVVAALGFLALAITQGHLMLRQWRLQRHRHRCGPRGFRRRSPGLHGCDPTYHCVRCGLTAHVFELNREDYRA